ncbi:hypothetical protein Tco_0771073 [Tanacetum coccineum]|uniref:Reverse transcriptase domain-containing protein n=1 Tax=Tanacetum coccineum TaxID=301880 RepID=A0ABQ4ZHJ0_9ASTR
MKSRDFNINKVDETFYEAWDRFNDLLRACPHHGFSELHQLDTFYNALNSNDQDSLNSAAGGNFLDKMPRDCLRIIESKSKVRNYVKHSVVAKTILLDKTLKLLLRESGREVVLLWWCSFVRIVPPALATLIVTISRVRLQAAAAKTTQGNTGYRAPISNQIRPPGFPPVQNNHNVQNQGNNQNRYNQNRGNFNQASTYQLPVHQGQIYRPRVIQPPAYQAPAPQIQGVSKEYFQAYVKANDAVMRNMQTQGQNMQNQLTNLTDMLSKFVTSNTASTSGTMIPTTSPKVVERETEVTKDTMPPTNNGSTKDVQPPVVPVVHHESISEPVIAPVSAPMPNQKTLIPFPSRRNNERRHEKANDQIEKFYEMFRDLSFEISLTDALILMPKFASTLKALIGNKEKLSEMARTPLNDNCSAVILNKLPKKTWRPWPISYSM